MERDGYAPSDVSYEQLKEFHESKQYDFSVSRGYHISLELTGMDAVLPALMQRNWVVIEATEQSGPFIASDNPVLLVWKNLEGIPPILQQSPGYGMRDTEVSFPVSRNLCVTGEFEGAEGKIEGTRELVSLINTRTAAFARERIFASKRSFGIVSPSGE